MIEDIPELIELAEELHSSIPSSSNGSSAIKWMIRAKDFASLCLDGTDLKPGLASAIPLRERGELLRAVLSIRTAGELFQGTKTAAEVTNSLTLLMAQLKGVALRSRQQSSWIIENTTQADVLLPLSSRKAFDSDLAAAISESSPTHPLALLMMDVDHFKKVNDTHGHQIGNEVLIAIAKTIRQCLISKGKGYRYGGEELTALNPNQGALEAVATAERIRSAIETLTFSIAGLRVTISIGVACCTEPRTTPELFFEKADKLVYDAKHGGRNRVVSSEVLERLLEQRTKSTVPAAVKLDAPIYLTPYQVVHYLADESQWGYQNGASNALLNAPVEFKKRAEEGRITVYGASLQTGSHELIPKTHWMSHGLDPSTIYNSEAVGKTVPATYEASLHGVRTGYTDLKIVAADVYQVWPRSDEANYSAAFELVGLSREEAIKIIWQLRRDGVAIRNEPISSEQQFPSWKAKYEEWRSAVLLVAEKVDEGLRQRLEVLDRLRPPPTLPAINQDHALCITIASEILLRLEERLP